MHKIFTTLLLMMALGACASIEEQPSPDYITNWVIPEAQPEEKSLPQFPTCDNSTAGDIYDCEWVAVMWGCEIASIYNAFLSRVTSNPITGKSELVEAPEICNAK